MDKSSLTAEFKGEYRDFDRAADHVHQKLQKIKKELDDLDSSFSKAGESGSSAFGGSLLSNLGEVLKALPGAGQVAGLALKAVEPIEKGVKMGLDFNDTLQKALISYTIFIGDSQKAVAHVERLKQLALDSSLQFTDLISASTHMQALGFSAEQAVHMIPILADATAGLGGGAVLMERVVLALGQMHTKGKVAGDDIRQLADAGIPVWKMLADYTGVAEERLMKMSEKGALKADKVIPILLQGIDEKFHGLDREFSHKTLTGAMSNATDALQQRLGQATQGAYQEAILAAQKFSDLMQTSYAQGVAGNVDRVATKVFGSINYLLSEAASGDALSAEADLVGGFKKGIESQVNEAYGAAAAMAGGTVKTVKDVLGIKSPSMVFKEIGSNTAIGFGKGFTEEMPATVIPGFNKSITALTDAVENPPELQRLINLIKKRGFEITDVDTPGVHNKGSAHDLGKAVDFRTKTKTASQVEEMFDYLTSRGYVVLDERSRPAHQKKWGGPHGHAQIGTEGITPRGMSHIWAGDGSAGRGLEQPSSQIGHAFGRW